MKVAINKFVVISFFVLTLIQTSSAWTSYQFNYDSDKVMMNETAIWIENSSWQQQCILYLQDTNPTYFASVYNALKDFCNNQKGTCWVWWENYTRADGTTYKKILQVGIQ
jgi:hypothetical protein